MSKTPLQLDLPGCAPLLVPLPTYPDPPFKVRVVYTSVCYAVAVLLQVMLCIEPAVAVSGPISLQPGQVWTASQTIVRHSSQE